MLMDIDGLKTINDHFGHLAGNNAIAITARVIRAIIGLGDLAVRYGGDEFLILSQDTDETVWEERRKEINLQLEKIATQQQLPYALGVSAGCAVSTKNAPLTIEESLDRADKAMYENKKRKKRGALA